MLLFPRLTQKKPRRPRQMTFDEIGSDYYPIDDKWALERKECYTVDPVNPVT